MISNVFFEWSCRSVSSEDTAMDYQELNSVWEIKKEYDRETQRLKDLRLFAQPSSPPIDGMPHAPTPQSSKVESLATLIVELETRLCELYAEWQCRQYQLVTALRNVHMKELSHRVLIFRYADCQSFNAIAKLLNFSRRYVMDLHEAGLRALGLNVQSMIQFQKTL